MSANRSPYNDRRIKRINTRAQNAESDPDQTHLHQYIDLEGGDARRQ